MQESEVAVACQELLAELKAEESNLIFHKKTKKFLARFGMENRRNSARIQQVEDFLAEYGIMLAHGKERRDSLAQFGKDDAISLRLATVAASTTAMPSFEKMGQEQVAYAHAGTIQVLTQNSGLKLYPHQEDAIAQMNQRIGKAGRDAFAGLLVLPTGGGKTLTAAYWLAKNLLDKGKKILWLAHRHELLEQAKKTFQERLAFQDILRNRPSFTYRIISGIHDKPVNIKPTDDLIISSKDSLNAGFSYLREKWLCYTDEVFLVIDEAHHATARTYRQLIEKLRGDGRTVRLVGLTATPFRTVEDEQGLLAKVFPDNIIYKVDLRTLIHRGILSKPIFEEVKTEFDVASLLNEEQVAAIGRFDLDKIGAATARTIAENQGRNRCIVDRYLRHRTRYRQTLVFALNQDNAIALKKLFEQRGVRCDYVLSSIRDAATGITISSQQNKEIIQRFRVGELEVLLNVNILTEGTDLPNVQTIFLARPTISPTLMTQMIGRGLRGEKAGGTPEAYIVSFIDNWQDKVAWVNPEKLLIETNTDFNDKREETQKQLLKLISISKIEEFALLADASIDRATRESIENTPFIERLPLGIYHFVLLSRDGEEAREKNCEILVYNNAQQAYTDFLQALPDIFAQRKFVDDAYLSEADLDKLSEAVETEFFYGYDLYPGYNPQDVRDVLQYYYQHREMPAYVALADRAQFDTQTVAQYILDNDLTRREEQEYKKQIWNENQPEWKVFFGRNEQYFLREVSLAVDRLSNPPLYAKPSVVPTNTKELRKLEAMTMQEIRQHKPLYWRWLSDQVYAKFRNADGSYFSASSGKSSRHKYQFQIDHIVPFSKGGLTTLDNLQLLFSPENARKGAS